MAGAEEREQRERRLAHGDVTVLLVTILGAAPESARRLDAREVRETTGDRGLGLLRSAVALEREHLLRSHASAVRRRIEIASGRVVVAAIGGRRDEIALGRPCLRRNERR